MTISGKYSLLEAEKRNFLLGYDKNVRYDSEEMDDIYHHACFPMG